MYIDASRRWCFRDIAVAQKIQEINPQNNRHVYYSTGGEDYGNIGILQFMMRDTKINIVKANYDLDTQSEADLLLLDYRSDQVQALEEKFDSQYKNGHFILYYNDNE
ncbi:MAG: hypothetical protein K2H91_11425, partial [Lachnospiraceae bacterium]|nr:hypothetical protein [Lachnospiraceae bacterium]